jgi:hypothetical protein
VRWLAERGPGSAGGSGAVPCGPGAGPELSSLMPSTYPPGVAAATAYSVAATSPAAAIVRSMSCSVWARLTNRAS